MDEDNLNWIICRFCRIPFKNKNLLSLHKKTEHSHLVENKQKTRRTQNVQEGSISDGKEKEEENSRKRKKEEISSSSVESKSILPPSKKAKPIPITSPVATDVTTNGNNNTSTIAESPCPVSTDTEKNTEAILFSTKPPQHSIDNVFHSFETQLLNLGEIDSTLYQEKEQEISPPRSSLVQACGNTNKNNNDDNHKVSINFNANANYFDDDDDEIEIIHMKLIKNEDKEKNNNKSNNSIMIKTEAPETPDNDHVNVNSGKIINLVQNINQEEKVEVIDEISVKSERNPIINSSNDIDLDVQMEKYFHCEDCHQKFLTMDNFNLHKRLKCGKQQLEPDSSSKRFTTSSSVGGNLHLIQTMGDDNNHKIVKIVKLIDIQLVEKNFAFSRFKIIQTNIKMRDKININPKNIITHNNNVEDETLDTNYIINPSIPVPHNNKSNNNNNTNDDDDDTNNDKNTVYPKAPLSFTTLTALALRSQGKSGVCDIYRFIMEEFPYFRTAPTENWRNSVRHTVATVKFFQKVDNEVLVQIGNRRRRALWQLNPVSLTALECRIRGECMKNRMEILKAMKNPHKFQTIVPS